MYAALITWNYSLSDNTGFLLQRSTDSGSTWTINYPLGMVFSYLDSAVVSYGTYWYKVAATNQYGTGSFSNIGSVFIPPEIPSPPHDLVVDSGSAILTWISGTINEEYFAVQKSLDGVGFSDFAVTLVETYTDIAVSSSAIGNTYWYQVAAVDISGTSSFSNTASITFIYDPPIGSITANVDSGSALVSWTSSISNATTWDIYKTLNSGPFTYLTGTLTATKSYRDENVTSSVGGNLYSYKMVAVNIYNSSSFSNTASITFTYDPPAVPLLLPVVSGSALVSWISQSFTTHHFLLWRSNNGLPGTFEPLTSVLWPLASYEDTTVTCSLSGQVYWYAVDAANIYGTSSLSNTQSITFTCPPIPAPFNLIAYQLPSYTERVVLEWDYTNSASFADGFIIERRLYHPSSASTHLQTITSSYVSSSEDTTVLFGLDYAYKALAYRGINSSSFSGDAAVFIYSPPPPLTPISLSVVSGSAILTWNSSSNDQDYFAVQRSISGAGGYSNFDTAVPETYTDITVTSSIAGTTYWYQVAAVNVYGTSSFSNTASITFIEIPSPSLPAFCVAPPFQGYGIHGTITQPEIISN